MERLIDAGKCPCSRCAVRPCASPGVCGDFALWLSKTVDAVEVVRCKDCKHSVWDEENEMWKCVESAEYDETSGEWYGFYEYHNGDFFCAHGERRTDD